VGETGGARTDQLEPICCPRLCKIAHIARFFFERKSGPGFFMKSLPSAIFGRTLAA
jgi:hypothetical protein